MTQFLGTTNIRMNNSRLVSSAAFIAFLLLSTFITTNVTGVSFYGASYVRLPLEDAKSMTDINFKFKTHRSDAFLFLAAGTTDYCLLVVEAGGLKVRINLGAGESEILTQQGLRLDDLTWHHVELKRVDALLTLVIDGILQSRMTIPGRFYELNIHYGLFVGGMGDFRELFLGIMEPYRGCIEDLTYNGIDVFRQARDVPDQLNIHMVTWDCSTEFDVTSERPFSLVSDGSFLAFSTMVARNGASFSCDLKTQANTSALLYNTGIPSESDYIAVELVDGHVRLAVDKGNGAVDLRSEGVVNDGLWHHVEVRFGPTFMEVVVDEHVSSLRPSLGENRHLDLVGPMYVGGIELNRRARAVAQGLVSMQNLASGDRAFKGCLWNLRVNDAAIGLREAHVTYGVQADCVWDYPCLRFPCIEEAKCVQEGLDGFRCLCDLPSCVKPDYNSNYKVYTSKAETSDVEVLDLQPLQVKEGGTELITSNNIDVVLDFHQYDVRESGVLFHVTQPPQYGKIGVDVYRRTGENLFTLLDLNTDKVHYTHDGSENHQDSLVIELEFLTRRERLPDFLSQRHRFVFHISVNPVNDPPEIRLPPGRVLRLAQNTRKLITPDILSAVDSDSDAKDLVFNVLSTGSEGDGQLENSRQPGKPVETFTQEDINNGLISYVHRGGATGRLTVKVSDGLEAAQTVSLRVAAFQLEITMVNNTGVTVAYNNHAYILSDNLTFSTNAHELDQDIRYDITRLPHYGHVQLLRHGGHWQTVNHFTQIQMVKDKVRYVHASGRPKHDEFKFSVSCNGVTTSTFFEFRITFTANRVVIVNNAELILDKVQEALIGAEHLRVETSPQPSEERDIAFSVKSLPSYGHLMMLPQPAVPPATHRHGHSQRFQKLQLGSNFSQADITAGHLKYRLNHKSYSVIKDTFNFSVQCNDVSLDIASFRINHIPAADRDATVVLGLLEVVEGERATIGNKVLYIKIGKFDNILYKVIETPKHGLLQLGDGSSNVTSFTSKDIDSGHLAFVHDDTEHDHDTIGILATAQIGDPEFQFVGRLPIRVIMKNDMKPERTIDRVFHVVTNGERILTARDLLFADADFGTTPSDLQYSRRGIPNGALFHMDKPDTPVFQFTQQDIDNEKILFRHTGATYGRTAIWVSDGKFFVNSILEIRASDPFINIVNNTGLVVKKSHIANITRSNLSIETNLNVGPTEVRYLVSVSPSHGAIIVDGKPATQFLQTDIDNERVAYRSDGGAYFGDTFAFEVHVRDTRSDGNFEVRIFPDSYWEPLEVSGNHSLSVEEGHRVTIDPVVLSVSHPNVDPREITFVVKQPPRHGYLATDVGSGTLSGAQHLATTIFDQSSVSERRVKYVHTERNASEDTVIFDVTNGIVTETDLKLTIDIIPSHIVLKTSKIVVNEGENITLSKNTVSAANRHFKDKIREYVIVEQPKHGRLVLMEEGRKHEKAQDGQLDRFAYEQLQSSNILYQHDDSETTEDRFVVVGNTEEMESLPATVEVEIVPVNDETPVISRNIKLEVWQGSTTVLSSDNLNAIDNDTSARDLWYAVVSPPTSGRLAVANNTEKAIANFTQEMVNRKDIVFVHAGPVSSSFTFQVKDGIHYSPKHVFSVVAKPVTLYVQNNNKLYVFPSLQQTITSRHLLALSSNWNQIEPITFTVKNRGSGPRLGKVVCLDADGSFREVKSFTQEQVNQSLVAYKHVRQFAELVATDTFTVDVSSPHAETLKDVVFNVEISVVTINPDGLEQYISTVPIVVDEGGTANVTGRNINTTGLTEVLNENRNTRFMPRLFLRVKGPPEHGSVTVEGNVLNNNTEFTQKDVDLGFVSYIHDHSDTLTDAVLLGILLDNSGVAGGSTVLLLNVTLDIRIRPVNDQRHELITTAPRIEVVQGQMVQICSENLKTVDADTSSREIRYDIISGPSNGKVVLHSANDVAVLSFTQQDIDDGKLWYIHDGGTLDTVSFHFKVSDGVFKPLYTVFNIHVVQLILELVNSSTIEVPQGTTSTYLKPNNLGAITNGNRSHIMYNVTTAPQRGHIFMNDGVVHNFAQDDIDAERVLYVQFNMSASSDSFVCTIWNEDHLLRDQVFSMKVRPLIKQRHANTASGAKLVLSLDVMDATQLAEKTKSNPVFTIVRRPKYGRLRRVFVRRKGHNKRESVTEDVLHFTQEDLVNGVVAYESKDFKVMSTTNDSFDFVLSAVGVQPAHGTMAISLHPKGTLAQASAITPIAQIPATDGDMGSSFVAPPQSTLGSPAAGSGILVSDTEAEKDQSPVFHPSLTNDHLLIIALAAGVVLITVFVIMTIRCVAHKRVKKPPKCLATRSSAAANGGPLPPPVLDAYNNVPTSDHHLHGAHDACMGYGDEDNDEDARGMRGVTPPMSTRSRPTSPRLRAHSHTAMQNNRLDQSMRGTPLPIPEEEWAEVSPAVPTCKVTPLSQNDQMDVNETTLKYPYGFVEPPPMESWGMYEPCADMPYNNRPVNPMLQKNQYWV